MKKEQAEGEPKYIKMDDSFFESKFFHDVLGDVIDDMVREFMEQDVTDVKISEETKRKILEMISNIRVKKQKDTATHDTPPRAEECEGDTVHQNE